MCAVSISIPYLRFMGTVHGLARVLALSILTGCIPASQYVQRSHLSGELQDRTGYGLRADASFSTNQLPPGVTLSDGVTESEAVALALWNNPLFQENLSKLGLVRSDLAQAGLLANPTFSILFPLGPKQ